MLLYMYVTKRYEDLFMILFIYIDKNAVSSYCYNLLINDYISIVMSDSDNISSGSKTKTLVSEDTDSINNISVKIPPFFSNIDVWIKLVKASFEIARPKVTRESTKYQYLICNLPPHILEKISDKLDDEIEAPFTTLVKVIQDRFRSSDSVIYNDIQKLSLVGKMPSDVLRDIKIKYNLLECNSDRILRETFLKILPEKIRFALIPQSRTTTLEVLAEMADSLFKCNEGTESVAALEPKDNTCDKDEVMQKMNERFSKIEETLNAISLRNTQAETRFNTRHNGPRYKQFCYYHRRFGRQAFKCEPPCSWITRSSPNTRRPRQGNF